MYGLTATRVLKSLANARGDISTAAAYAKARQWADSGSVIAYISKASVAGMESASALDGSGDASLDLQMALRPLSAVGRLPVQRVPAMTPLLTQTTGATANWIGESKARKASIGAYTRSSLQLKTVAALSVASNELLAAQSLDAENAVLADLLGACVQALDSAFLDPANTGDAAIPASITSTANVLTAASSSIASIDAALHAAVASLTDAGSNLMRAYWICSPAVGAALGLLRGTGGAAAYPGMGALGGFLLGLPCITSGAISAASDGDYIVLVDAAQIAYTEGLPALRTSQNASIEQSDAPTGASDSPTGATASIVGMFQADATALLASFYANWEPRRSGAVALIDGLDLSTPTSL